MTEIRGELAKKPIVPQGLRIDGVGTAHAFLTPLPPTGVTSAVRTLQITQQW